MNREIKFRARCAFSGVWRYGFYYVSKGNHIIRDENDKESIVLEKTLGEFTGLHDRNGKEIYEGDILKTIGNNVKVTFGTSSKYPSSFLMENRYVLMPFENTMAEISEIIGNIFENPDLVKL